MAKKINQTKIICTEKFAENMNQDCINSAIKLLSNNMDNDELPLNDPPLNF